MRKAPFTEEQIVGNFAGVGWRGKGLGALPETRYIGRHPVQVESQIWRHDSIRVTPAEGSGGRDLLASRLQADAMLDNAGPKGLLAKNS